MKSWETAGTRLKQLVARRRTLGYVDTEQAEGQRRYTLEDESVSLLYPFRLSLDIEPLLGESLYDCVVACYLVVKGHFNPVYHPVGINVLDTFRSP